MAVIFGEPAIQLLIIKLSTLIIVLGRKSIRKQDKYKNYLKSEIRRYKETIAIPHFEPEQPFGSYFQKKIIEDEF